MTHSIAVVILNYNGKGLLKTFLPAVVQYSQGARIIIADNNSCDGSQEFVRHEFPQVELIQIPQNLGFCGGYNYALDGVAGDYYVLLNSDIEVTPNWMEPVMRIFEQDNTIGAIQPKILSYKEKTKFEYAGAGGGFVDRLGYPFCRGRIFNSVEYDNCQYNDTVPVFWITGACLFIRAELYKKVGKLDEDFFVHMEEIDLCWRINRAGYKIIYCGESHVYHIGGATLARSNHVKTYYNFRNGITLLIKNMVFTEFILFFPIRLILDWIAALKFLLEGYPKDSWAVLRAHIYMVRKSLMLYRKRKHVKALIPSYQVRQMYKGSIVFDYFILKKRSYRDLKHGVTAQKFKK